MDWRIFLGVIGGFLGLLCLALLLAFIIRYRQMARARRRMTEFLPLLKPGTLVSVDEGKRTFRVVKVLVVDKKAVHVRLYRGRWLWRPTLQEITPDDLTLANTEGHDAPAAVGHLPVTLEAFARWQPLRLRTEAVAPDELDGYEVWKQAGGGVFG